MPLQAKTSSARAAGPPNASFSSNATHPQHSNSNKATSLSLKHALQRPCTPWVESTEYDQSSQAHLEPGSVVLVVAPELALELASSQVLLEGVRLVVERPEQGLRVQLLVQPGVLQHGQALVGVGVGQAARWHAL